MILRLETTNLHSKLQESVFKTRLESSQDLITDLTQSREIIQGISQESRVLVEKLHVKSHVLSQPIFTTARAK